MELKKTKLKKHKKQQQKATKTDKIQHKMENERECQSDPKQEKKAKQVKKAKQGLSTSSSGKQNSSSSTAQTNGTIESIQPAVADSELDSLFKSSKFTSLQLAPAPVPGTATTAGVQEKNHDPQRVKTNHSVDQQQTLTTQHQRLTAKSGKKKQKDRHLNDTLTSSDQLQLAIQRATEFAKQIKLDSKSPLDLTKPVIRPNDTITSKKLRFSSDIDTKNGDSSNFHDFSQDDRPSSDDSNSSDTSLAHETLLKESTDTTLTVKPETLKSAKKDSNVTSEEKNDRTVFVGNVPIECVTKKSTARSLLEHLLNPLKKENPLASKTRIESIRYRGIPLAAPIVDEQRANERATKRVKAWKEAQAESLLAFDDETGGRAGRRGAKPLISSDTTAAPPIQLLTPGQKRKIGYVTQKFHPEAKSCIAYVVIAHAPEASQEETKIFPTAKDLAKMIAVEADGTSFLDHVLRCDIAQGASSKTSNKQKICSIDLDERRRTLFIGGLDFLEDEDSIRNAVERKLMEEKGGLPDGATTWVERVRVIRDKATSLNKGFAYVLLRTQDALMEMLALPEESFKIGKRKVRLRKHLSAGQTSALKKIKDPKTDDKRKKMDPKTDEKRKKIRFDLTKEIETNYKGPDQSKELAKLSKTERKQVKSNNALRVERRILKKQNKIKLKILSTINTKSISDTQTLKPLKNKLKHKKSVKLDSKSKFQKKKIKKPTDHSSA